MDDAGCWRVCYAERDDGPFLYRWRGTADYGPSKFGRYPGDPPSYTGRRVDFLGRSLRASLDAGTEATGTSQLWPPPE